MTADERACADWARRKARKIQDEVTLNNGATTFTVTEDAANVLPNHMRDYKASQDCWYLHEGMPKRARGFTRAADGTLRADTMLVTRDGVTTVVSSHRFGATRTTRTTRTTSTTRAPESASLPSIREGEVY